ncbi:helical backbone metal receptor [Burkholderia gladioli]|uniref:heme/hemin ABC transporter substrate-binding protein n=1 Tax=Burkholderia gladioli TaxID=28095 RepID=UPI002653B402|nr:helical backbone metal receptor [Burkholderia gladioli]MDN7922539.1 helical backbone metal receptor [Burkholderia gladioli]
MSRLRSYLAAPSEPHRVVVIGGALAEIVYALGRADRLVGTDTTCTFPAPARALPKIGYQRSLSAESLLALRPDLVLASAEAGPTSALDQVRRTGIDVDLFAEHHDVGSVRDKIDGIARALGAEAAGREQLARFDRDWAQAISGAKPVPRRVLFVMDPAGRQPMVAGQRTAADAMLRYAGFTNAIEGVEGYKMLSSEALVAAQPEVVLTTDDTLRAAGGAQALLSSAGFSLTPAGRASRVVALDALFLLGFGPRLPQAVTALRRKLVAA